jgi:hypothetical protein
VIVTQKIRLLLKCKSALIMAAILPTMIFISNIPHVLADPAHCDQPGWPSCYDVGYGDGQQNPGTGCPSGHSENFCNGWDAGANSNGNSQSQAGSSGNEGQQPGYSLTVYVRSHSFGVSSVEITIQAANGYSDSQNVSTQGGASWTFNIPPNEGNSVKVCAHEGIVSYALGNACYNFNVNPNGGSQSVTINAG